MRFGSENSTKTIVAIALAVVAVIMTARMISSSFSSSSNSAPPATTVAASTQAAQRPSRRGARGRNAIARKTNAGPVTPSLDPRLKLNLLSETEGLEYTGEGRNIFKSNAEDIAIPKPVAPGRTDQAKVQPPVPPPYTPPPPPPINLKFFGFASQQGLKKVFLSSGEDVFVASEGDIVQRRYKIMKINPNSIEVQDVLSNNRQTIPLTAG